MRKYFKATKIEDERIREYYLHPVQRIRKGIQGKEKQKKANFFMQNSKNILVTDFK